MRDSRIGTYGASALILAYLIKASAYQVLLAAPPLQIILVLAACAAFSRAMVVDMMWATRPARSDGLSHMAGRPSRNTGLFAIVTAGAFAVWAGWAIDPMRGVIAIAVALLITGILRRLAMRLLGGQTGDICGAVQVLSECGMLCAYLASIH
jgi:adenosylcobinamide-GDP ribazoletransferase